jgi:hypothetical protein
MVPGVALALQIVQGQPEAALCTVKVALLLVTLFRLAVIVVPPAPCPVANPELLMLAADGLEEFHVTCELMSCVLLS